MARTLLYVPNATGSSPAVTLTVDDIPAEIRQEVEDIYAQLKANPNGRIRAEFEDLAELRQYTRHVTAYCSLRPAGALRFRKSPARGLPENVMDFRIADPLPEREATTEGIRESVKAVKAAAKAAPVPAKATPIRTAAAALAPKTTTAKVATPAAMPAKRGPGRPRKS